MKRVRVQQQPYLSNTYPGAVLCRDLTFSENGKRVSLRRGTPVDEVESRLRGNETNAELHLLVPEDDDITQEDASQRIAAAIGGDGLESTDPHQGQVDLRSAVFGVLRVDPDAIKRINQSGIALIASVLDGRVTEPGETVAIVKASELLVSSSDVDRVLADLEGRTVVRVAPFTRSRVALIAGDRIREANLKVSSKHLAAGLARYGAELADVRKIPDDPAGVAGTYQELIDGGIELILVAGSIVLDPEDPYLEALQHIDAELVRRGAPIDPGTMFWVAKKGDVPFFGLASCEMYGRLSIIDLFLPYALAGEVIDSDLISRLGYGGLLNDTHVVLRPASWRE